MKIKNILIIFIIILLSINSSSAINFSQVGGISTIYGDVTYEYFNASGVTFTPAEWNGTANTGYLNLTVTKIFNTTDVTFSGVGAGDYGGYIGSFSGTSGEGVGGGGGVTYRGSPGGGGGGASHLTSGTSGQNGGAAGTTFGSSNIADISKGSGGGQGSGYNCFGAAGGDGGGYFYIKAQKIIFNGNITVNGSVGGNGACSNTGAGGGGSAGDIIFNSNDMNISNAKFYSKGGVGGAGGGGAPSGGIGGNGGDGKVIIIYGTLKNTSTIVDSGFVYYYGIKYNDYTKNDTSNFSILKGNVVNLYFNTTISDWTVGGFSQGFTSSIFPYTVIGSNNTTTIEAITPYGNATWNITSLVYPFQQLSPANTSTVSKSTTLQWREWPQNGIYTYQVATNSAFTNVISSGTVASSTELFSQSIDVGSYGTFYWHVKNSSVGTYLPTWEFITSSAISQGSLNVTVRNEQFNNIIVGNFTTYLYKGFGSTSIVATKTTSTGWTNFTSADGIIQEEYVVQVVPIGTNISYQERTQLATPNTTLIMYSPNSATENISINQLQLNDITGLFPVASTDIYIYKNGSIMYSNYFGADTNANVHLIIGNQYSIILRNGNNIWNYGYFTPIASGAQQLLVSNFILNSSLQQPFIYNISYSSTDITLNYNLQNGTLSHLYFNIYKNNLLTNVHTLNTTLGVGQSMYAVTDLNAIYYVTFEACFTGVTTCRTTSFPIDYRVGLRRNSTDVNPFDGTPAGIGFNFGGLLPQSWLNWFVALIVIVLIGSFGGVYSGLGVIIALIMLLIFESVGMFIPAATTDPHNYLTMGITGGLLVLAIALYMKSKR